MSKTVIILGAGASADAGAPVMAKFIDVAEELWARGTISEASPKSDFELVFKGIHALQSAYAKSWIDPDNLESIFVAFEMAKQLGRLGELTPDDVNQLPAAFRRVIVRTLQETIQYPLFNEGGGHRLDYLKPPAAYADLAAFVAKRRSEISLITFNYDCAMDYALTFEGIPFNYRYDDTAHKNEVDLLKLHGSMNWFSGSKPIFHVPFPPQMKRGTYTRTESDSQNARISIPLMYNSSARTPELLTDPIIVPPTWNKGEHQSRILSVWQAAARQLSDAEHIIIAGYSFPPTDEAFRYLFALGTIGPTRLRTIAVIDLYPSKVLDERVRKMLGPMALPRYSLYRSTFASFAGKLHDTNLNIDGALTSLEAMRF